MQLAFVRAVTLSGVAAMLFLGCARAPRPSVPAAAIQPEDKPEQAAEFYLRKRVPPGQELPAEKYLEAAERMKRMPLYSSRSRAFVNSGKRTEREINLGAWESLGPGNVGGRTRSLLIHPGDPKIMYAAGVAGGIWKTTDGGESWRHLDDSLPNLGVTTMAMDPRNPDVIYAGTGEYYTTGSADIGNSLRGSGILKTADGGVTWTLLPATTGTTAFHYVNKVVVSPNDSNRVYAAVWGGVMLSRNGGGTWTRVLNRTSPNNGCQDIVIRTDQTQDYVFASCGTTTANGVRPAIFRNIDAAGAGTWDAVHTPAGMARTSLALAPSNQSVIYALAASDEAGDYRRGLLAVFRSSNNGDPDSWEVRVDNKNENRLFTGLLSNTQPLHAPLCNGGRGSYINQGNYDNVIAVDPLDPDRVWAGGIDLFRSDDGGATWGIASYWWARNTPQWSHSDHHILVFHPQYNGTDNQILFNGNDGGVFRTDNARADVARGERAPCASANSSIAWKPLNNNYGVTQFYHGVPYPGGAGYIGGTQDNGTVRGTDATGGNSWSRIAGGDGGFVAVDPRNVNVIYAENTELSFLKSINGGRSFTTSIRGITEPGTNFAFIAPFTMDPSDPDRLWIGGRSLWRTTDAARTWTQAGAPFAGSVSAIAIAPTDPNKALIGIETGAIHRSSNALATDRESVWEQTSPRTGYVSRITFDPADSNVAYATYSLFKQSADQSHVYKTTDGGVTWTGIDGSGTSGIPDIPVHGIAVNPDSTQTLYAATDLGIFVSLDGGGTWSREDTGFPNTTTESLQVEKGAGAPVLYAFTHGRGAWRVRLGAGGCAYEAPERIVLPAFGRPAAGRVQSADGCVWTAISEATWLDAETPNGKGSGSANFAAATNFSTASRSTRAIIANKAVEVVQEGAVAVQNNDEASSSAVIDALPYVGVQDTRFATLGTGDPVHSCTASRDSKSVWFRLRSPISGTIRVDVIARRPENLNQNAGIVLTVYPGTGPAQELHCNRTGTTGLSAMTVDIPVDQGTEHLIQLSGLGAENPGSMLSITASQK